MDFIVEKLAEIEATAHSIVEHAESQKPIMEKEVQEKRDQFDHDLEVETQEKLHAIRAQLKEKTDKLLNQQHAKNSFTIDGLVSDFDENHTSYAKSILAHMTGV